MTQKDAEKIYCSECKGTGIGNDLKACRYCACPPEDFIDHLRVQLTALAAFLHCGAGENPILKAMQDIKRLDKELTEFRLLAQTLTEIAFHKGLDKTLEEANSDYHLSIKQVQNKAARLLQAFPHPTATQLINIADSYTEGFDDALAGEGE